MATSNFKIDVNVKDIDLFKNLVELLEKHNDDLPTELQESLKSISKNGIKDFTSDDFYKMFPDADYALVETSFKSTNIIGMNKILKRVEYFEDGEKLTEYPETFYLKYDSEIIIEW